MERLKMSGILYEDSKVVHDAILILCGMVETLEKECMVRDEGKVASELFIHINGLKRELIKMQNESERIVRIADIDQFGPLSEYVRSYLC